MAILLFDKAWRESRTRFLVGGIAMAAYCAFIVLFRPVAEHSLAARSLAVSFSAYINSEIFSGLSTLFFVLLVILLGLGGLLRERRQHTAVFTLALPVSRAQLVGAQIAVGLTELAVLALVPTLLIPPLSALVHQSYPITEALRFTVLRFICGTEIFAISFLLSAILRGGYTAPVACNIAIFLQTRANNWGRLGRYVLNPLAAMNGRWSNESRLSVDAPLPWLGLSILVVMALALFAAATRITEKQSL
jgi:ABC-type transport system involved in multi-copper enzyme maturation permease subunit